MFNVKVPILVLFGTVVTQPAAEHSAGRAETFDRKLVGAQIGQGWQRRCRLMAAGFLASSDAPERAVNAGP